MIIAEFCRPEPSQGSDDHPERVRRDDTARPPRSLHPARRPVHTTPPDPRPSRDLRLEAHGPGLAHAFREDIDYFADRALGLLASAQDGTPEAAGAFGRYRAPLTRAGARTVVARRHGFAG